MFCLVPLKLGLFLTIREFGSSFKTLAVSVVSDLYWHLFTWHQKHLCKFTCFAVGDCRSRIWGPLYREPRAIKCCLFFESLEQVRIWPCTLPLQLILPSWLILLYFCPHHPFSNKKEKWRVTCSFSLFFLLPFSSLIVYNTCDCLCFTGAEWIFARIQ